MHSSIILIDTEPIEDHVFIDPEDFYDCNEIDYADTIDKKSQRKRLDEFINTVLPEDMFDMESENVLVYNGGMDVWKEQWIRKLKHRISHTTAENCFRYDTHSKLERTINNPLNTPILFVIPPSGSYSNLFTSYELMNVINGMEKGDKLYLGNVLDYHF